MTKSKPTTTKRPTTWSAENKLAAAAKSAPSRKPLASAKATATGRSVPRKKQASVAPPTAAVVTTPLRQTKKATIAALLQRPQGAAMAELTGATGWLEHSVRAALTGLRKEGQEIIRTKQPDRATNYAIGAGG